MSFSQLKNEVQMLRDELAIMQRKYEDILYNLDDNNFSSRFVKEKENMKTAISVTAEGIESKVSKEDFNSQMMQTAEAIKTKVSKDEFESEIKQTAEAIRSVVSKGAKLDEAIVITSIDDATDTENIYVIQEKDEDDTLLSETYYYFNDITKKWEVLSGDCIYTVFNQTAEGFALKGNVKISGDLITDGTISADRISTEIAKVNKTLTIGNLTDKDQKKIQFSSGARIQTYEDYMGLPPTGIELAGSSVRLNCTYLDLNDCSEVYWGDNAPPAVFA